MNLPFHVGPELEQPCQRLLDVVHVEHQLGGGSGMRWRYPAEGDVAHAAKHHSEGNTRHL